MYFEPFLRSFVLGLSTGAAFEAINVAGKLIDLLGANDFANALPKMMEHAPMFVDDHLVAVGCWAMFYAIEVYAILKVLDKHAQNPEAAADAVRKLTTLPRLMLPRFSFFKQLFSAFGVSGVPLTEAQAGSGVLAPPRTPGPVRNSIVTAPPRPQTAPKPQPPILDPRQEPEGPDDGKSGSSRKRRQGLRPGQLDLGTAGLLHRQKELSSRRCYLSNFWYAVGISEQLKDKPLGVEILGEKVVLFRDAQGKVICLQDVCPHRGAPLHMGWVSNVKGHDCIVCPYHGWAFDKEGTLKDVPAAEHDDEWPKMPILEGYPVEEKGGFIWLFYGSKSLPEAERPPIPYVPELEDPKWQPVYGEIEFECNHWSVFENAIDMAHIHYLHSNSFGNTEMPQIRNMTCTSNAYGINADFVLHNKPVNALWDFSKVPEVEVNAKALLPSSSVIGFSLARGLSFITFVNTVPISATRTVNRFALIRRLDVDPIGAAVFNSPRLDFAAREAMMQILTEDKAMVEALEPEMLGREISVKADMPQMAFRKLRKQYIDLGYGVAPDSKSILSPNRDM